MTGQSETKDQKLILLARFKCATCEKHWTFAVT